MRVNWPIWSQNNRRTSRLTRLYNSRLCISLTFRAGKHAILRNHRSMHLFQPVKNIKRITMTDSNDPSLSRRKWLGLAAGASLGTGLLALTQAAEAQETKSSA